MRCRVLPGGAAIATVWLLAACSDIHPISEDPPGSVASSMPRTLVLEQPIRILSSSYPAGRYGAHYSDGHGVYYEANYVAGKSPERPKGGLPEILNPGFFVPFQNYADVQPFDHNDEIALFFYDRVPDMRFHFER